MLRFKALLARLFARLGLRKIAPKVSPEEVKSSLRASHQAALQDLEVARDANRAVGQAYSRKATVHTAKASTATSRASSYTSEADTAQSMHSALSASLLNSSGLWDAPSRDSSRDDGDRAGTSSLGSCVISLASDSGSSSSSCCGSSDSGSSSSPSCD